MAKLKDFPLFMTGCTAIMLDNGCHSGPDGHEINPEAETSEYTEALTYIECVLAGLKGLSIQQHCPEILKMEFYEDIKPTDKVLGYIYLGVNDSTEIVLSAAKLASHEIWLVNHVFNQFFEGELHDRFTKPRTRRINHSSRKH